MFDQILHGYVAFLKLDCSFKKVLSKKAKQNKKDIKFIRFTQNKLKRKIK